VIQRITVLVATLALGLFLAPSLATAAHHEKEEHGKSNPCAAKENPCNPCNPCAAEKNPCAAKENPCNPCAAKKKNPCSGYD